MTAHAKQMWEKLIDFVEGSDSPEVRDHLVVCTDCQRSVEQIKRMFEVGKIATFSPPQSVLAAAYAIMPVRVKRLQLLRTSLQLSGARSTVAEDFQVVYGDNDLSVRVMYSPNGKNWDVMATLPDEHYTASKQGDEISISSDLGLMFTAKDLSDAGFTIQKGDSILEIPSPQEVIVDGP